MRPTEREKYEVIARLGKLGIDPDTAQKLRRISMTLRNWFELECGTGDERVTRSIEREDNGEGRPFLRVQFLGRSLGHDGIWQDTWTPIRDLEAGAMKRLDKIMTGLRGLRYYVQGDCRGCSLYILRRKDLKDGEDINAVYTRGVAVY